MTRPHKITSAKRRSYARRRKMSACRGLSSSICGNRTSCSYASGFYRQFCRRRNNTPHHISLPPRSITRRSRSTSLKKNKSRVVALRRSQRIKNRRSSNV